VCASASVEPWECPDHHAGRRRLRGCRHPRTSRDYPTLLDLPAPRLLGYSRESAIAEKFEAMVKLGTLNSRMKDFFDIWLLSRQFEFDGRILSDAVRKTFTHRWTEIPASPVALTEVFSEDPAKLSQWRAFARKSRMPAIPESLRDVVGSLALFLGPVTEALSRQDAFHRNWSPPGPWVGGTSPSRPEATIRTGKEREDAP